jgi:hypothetical protein
LGSDDEVVIQQDFDDNEIILGHEVITLASDVESICSHSNMSRNPSSKLVEAAVLSLRSDGRTQRELNHISTTFKFRAFHYGRTIG